MKNPPRPEFDDPFTCSPVSAWILYDLWFWNWQNKAAAVLLVIGLAANNFGREIPRQDQCVIRTIAHQPFWRTYWQPRSRRDFILFEGRIVDDVIQIFRCQPAGIQQGVALGGSAVTDHTLAPGTQFSDQPW